MIFQNYPLFFSPLPIIRLSLPSQEKEGRENEIGGGCQLERVVSDGRDDAGKVPVGFTREGGRGRWWYERTKKNEQKG
ncbi:unnamed protein product, partial [Vitis vinifera]